MAWRIRWLLSIGLLALSVGCSAESKDQKAAKTPATAPDAANEKSKTAEQPSSPNDSNASAKSEPAADAGLQPFTPPPLAELDAKAEWVDQPVVDSLKLLAEQFAKEPPLATAQEALALRNDSKEANAKILSALGRLPKTDADVNWESTINRHMIGDVKSTNPLLINSVQEFQFQNLTGIGLFGFDWNMQPFAITDTVVSWQTSKDRMLDKVVMRDDLTWSDGQKITAHDVAFSFQTIMNPKVPATAVRSGTDQIRWVEAYDDRTVVFFHKESLATNIWNVNFAIIPKHIYEESLKSDPTLQDSDYHVKLENDPVCGGPYTVARRTRGQEIVLARRESYYIQNGKQVRDKPYFKEVRFRVIEDPNTSLLALKTEQLDEMELLAEQWQSQTGNDEFYQHNTKAYGAEWTYFYFGWNCNDPCPFFKDVRVRKAMSYAFDYDEMLKLNYNLYERCNGIFNPAAWMAPKTPLPFYKRDLDKAEELLDAAGWTDHDNDGIRDKQIGGRSVPFEFTMLCINVPERIKLCTLLKENLRQIGVICNVPPLEATALQDAEMKHKFDACFGGWGTGTDPDTSENIWTTHAITEGRNFVQYSNPQVDKLFEQGKREFDREKRAAIYAKIDELIYEDQPCTFLYFRNSFYAFNKQIRGYRFSPRGPYDYSPGIGSIWKVVP